MDSMVASDARQRTIWRFNQINIAAMSAWMTVLLAVHRFTHWLTTLPRVFRRMLRPARVFTVALLLGLVATPTTLYFMERGRHLDTRRAYRQLTVASTTENRYLQSTVRQLLDEQSRLASLVLDSGNTLHAGNKVYVKVLATGYSSSIAETDSTPLVTAANTRTQIGVLAISQDLLSEYTPGAPFSFGDRVHVYGVGEFIVQDAMNARWANRVDIWFRTRDEAVRFGVREAVLSGALAEGTSVDEATLSGNYSTQLDPGGL